MKLENAKISMLIGSDVTRIEVEDGDANITIISIELTPEQLSEILSRRVLVKCSKCVTGDLSKVGKKHINNKLEFEIGKDTDRKDVDYLHQIAISSLADANMSEWEPDKYYGSSDSFFDKRGKSFARVTIRKWV